MLAKKTIYMEKKMKKQNISQKITGVFFAALLVAVGARALPNLNTHTALAAGETDFQAGLFDEDDDGAREDHDDDRFGDDDYDRGFDRRGGGVFRFLFILIPVFLVLGLAGLGWFFSRRRKAAAAVTANAPPPVPDEPTPSDEA